MLAMIARVAHGRFHAIGEGNLAVEDLEVPECFQRGSLELRVEKQRRQVTVHAADHRLSDGAAGVTFVMGEPADIIPPFVLSCFGDPDRVLERL